MATMAIEPTEAELTAATRQIEAFLTILETRYNIKPEEVPTMLETIKWMGKHRARMEQATWVAASTLIILSITGLAQSSWQHLKAFFHH